MFNFRLYLINNHFKLFFMKRILLFLFVFISCFNIGNSQLSSGTTAPDWTVTDLDGNSHNLYSLLNSGVDVVMDVSATWCGPCWNYHHSGILSNIHNSGNAMVFFMEGDASTNLACLYGPSGCVGGTQGNWVAGTPYPIVHEQGPSVRAAYAVNAYPTIFIISARNKKSYTNGGGGPSQSYIESFLLESFKLDAYPTVADASCGKDGSIELDVVYGHGALRYAWSNGATSKNIYNLDPGVYTVTITDANNYDIEVGPFNVGGTFIQLTSFPIEEINPSCFGGTNGLATFTASGGTPGYSYLWDDGTTNQTKINCGAGEHHVTVTDANGCTIDNFVVLEEPEQISASSSAPTIPCGSSKGTITISAEGGIYPYTYDIGNGPQSSGQFNDVDPGTYNYLVKDFNNCTFNGIVTLLAIEGPEAVASVNGGITCEISEVELSGEGSSTGDDYIYLWKTDDGVIVSGQDSIIAVVSAGGTYVLEVTDNSNGCISSATVEVEQSVDVPQASIEVPEQLTCLVSEIQLDAQINGDAEDFIISWATSNGNIVTGGNTLTPTVDGAGYYVLTLESILNGCTADKGVEVVAFLNIPSGSYDYSFEEGTFEGDPQTNSSNNTYLWDFGNGNTSTDENPIVELGEGTFEICLTVSNECGSDMKCRVVSNLSILTIGSSSSTNIVCFGENNGTISLDVVGGKAPYTYSWTGPDGFSSTESSLSGLAAGVYSVVVADANGNSVEETFTITEPEAIVVSLVNIVNDKGNQGEGSISIEVKGGSGSLTYLWSNGETTSNINSLVEGSYTCTITDRNGCEKVVGPFIVENTTSTNEAKYLTSFNVFPNPASNAIYLNVEFINKEHVSLEIYNTLGHSVILNKYENNISDIIDISNLPGGVYQLVLTGNEFKIARRIVVIR